MTRWQVCHQSGRVLFTTDNEVTARNRKQFGWKVIEVDKSREQFEAEMAKLGDCVDMRRAKNGDEEYMAWDVRLAWQFWQASRAAIEIELPELKMLKDYLSDVTMREREDILVGVQLEFLRKISAKGIKVKS